ncbi:MAG: LysR family transcriptional regulator [Pseudomonadota bacterium]
MQDEDWDDLHLALVIARAGTLSQAGRVLGVDESTVKRRLVRAERRLGVRLFDRVAGRLCPTDPGAGFVARAVEVEAGIEGAFAGIRGRDRELAGTVRLTAVPMVANRLLAPALPALMAAAPGLTLQLIAEPQSLSLLNREADIALRLARPTGEAGVRARRIATLGYALYGRRAGLPWITYEDRLRDLPQTAWVAARVAEQGARAPVEVSDAETLIAVLEAGAGQGILPVLIGDALPGLPRLSPEIALERELWMLVHPDLGDLPRIRAVTDWVRALFRKQGSSAVSDMAQ